MLHTAPDIDPSKPQNSLNMWKKLTPLTIEEILTESKIDIDFEDQEFEFRETRGESAYI